MRSPRNNQQGAALFIALVFLVIITLISITAMRTSSLELLMASNEQGQRIALDAAQSAAAVVAQSNRVRIGANGEITCFGFDYDPAGTSTISGEDCFRTENIPASAGIDDNNFVQVTVEGSGTCPPGMQSSARGDTSLYHSAGSGSGGGCLYFSLDSLHDATANRGGRGLIHEGFIRLGN